MAEVSRSSKRFLERHGVRPADTGPRRFAVFGGRSGVHAVPADAGRRVVALAEAAEIAEPVDRGSTRPWPYGEASGGP
jgi:hypothetical protein